MSEQLFDDGGFLPPGGLVWVANPGTKPERILSSDQWHRIGYLTGGPSQELIWRLNQRLKGKDPGRPINWKGVR